MIAVLARWCVPSEALRWGMLTAEPLAWHTEMFHRSWMLAQRDIARMLAPVWDRFVDSFRQVSALFDDLADAERAEFRRRYLTEQDPPS